MKKILLLIIALVVLVPGVAKAAQTKYGDLTIECPSTGVAPGEQHECYLYVSNPNGIDAIAGEFYALEKTTIISVTPAAGWDDAGGTTGLKINLQSSTPYTSKTRVASVIVQLDSDWSKELYGNKCGPGFKATGVSTPIPPTYPSNPETGASMPYLVVGTGIILAAGIYVIANKKEKFYKI